MRHTKLAFQGFERKTILMRDRQGRHVKSRNLNVLSLSGGNINDMYKFAPSNKHFSKIILFVDKNYLYNGCEQNFIKKSD